MFSMTQVTFPKRMVGIHSYVCPLVLKPDLEDMEEPSEMRQELMNRVENVMNKACDYRSSFDGYTYLWVDDRQEFMRQVSIDTLIQELLNKLHFDLHTSCCMTYAYLSVSQIK